MISCVLLSAGYSSRFGSPKALVNFDGSKLIERLQNILLASNLDEIIVVLGANAQDIEPYLLKHTKIKVVYNKDYNLGQTSSFKAGLKTVSVSSKGIMLLPVDFPLIAAATIKGLVDQFSRREPLVLIPTYLNKKGHPSVFHQSLAQELLALKDEEGINTVVHRHTDEVQLCPVKDEGILLSFNTREELAELTSRLK